MLLELVGINTLLTGLIVEEQALKPTSSNSILMPSTLIGSNSVYLAFLSKQLIPIYPKAPYSWVHSVLHNITGRTRI
jgi:hypothetical protein